ncbi:ABC transporter permease [Abyssalbus ytuae]
MVTFFVVVVGAAALFIVLSGFSGLKTFSLSFANTFDPDLKAVASTGKFYEITPDEESKLKDIDGIAVFSKEIEERVYLDYKQKSHMPYLKGVDDNYNRVTGIDSIIFYGGWLNNYPNQVVPGIATSNLLGLAANDNLNPLRILAPKPGKGSITGQSKPYNELLTTATGFYAINEELDKKYVFAHLSTVQRLLEKNENQITGINFKLEPGADKKEVLQKIQEVLKDKAEIKTRAQLNDALYRMLNTENLAIYLIFTLVLIVALFNVVGAIIMMILDKQANLKTLFSLGTTVKELRRVFFLQGIMVTVFGGFIGIIIGGALTVIQTSTGIIRITPSLPYPMEFKLFNVAVVLATITVLGLIAAKIASGRITGKLIN